MTRKFERFGTVHSSHHILLAAQCANCRHYAKGGKCAAFPKGIPDDIRTSKHDHRKPYPGDNGIRFEPLEESEK